MFMLDSEAKRILKKLIALLVIFIVINVSFFVYLKDKTVAFIPLKQKAELMSKKFPDSKWIIGGDSIAQTGLNPLLIGNGKTVNVSYPGTGISGFEKALKFHFPGKIDKDSVLIVNLSVLNSNDRPITNEKFLNLMDSFFETGFVFLAKNWKIDFFRHLFSVYQCHFAHCPYYEVRFISENMPLKTKGYQPLPDSQIDFSQMDEKFIQRYESYYKDYIGDGAIFKVNQQSFKNLIATGAKVIIITFPMMDAIKVSKGMAPLRDKVKAMMMATQKMCESYPNCAFLNYVLWDNQKLGENPYDYFYDYVHLNEKGSQIFSKIVNEDITNALGKMKP